MRGSVGEAWGGQSPIDLGTLVLKSHLLAFCNMAIRHQVVAGDQPKGKATISKGALFGSNWLGDDLRIGVYGLPA
jgi:hypothetical protein